MSDDKKVVRLADVSESCHHWTPVDALKEAIHRIESGELPANKVFIIMVDMTPDDHRIGYTNCGFNKLETVAILESVKMRMFEEMNYFDGSR